MALPINLRGILSLANLSLWSGNKIQKSCIQARKKKRKRFTSLRSWKRVMPNLGWCNFKRKLRAVAERARSKDIFRSPIQCFLSLAQNVPYFSTCINNSKVWGKAARMLGRCCKKRIFNHHYPYFEELWDMSPFSLVEMWEWVVCKLQGPLLKLRRHRFIQVS